MNHPAAAPRASLQVALLSGACVRHDAISYSLRLKLDLLRSLRRSGHSIEVRAFVQGTDLDDVDIRVVSLGDLLLDPSFSQSDIAIYEYGIAYELFDSIFALAPGQRSIGIYHNVTPLVLVEIPEAYKRVQRGLLLRNNLARLDHVACDSEFNRQDLVSLGLPEERLSVLAIPPQLHPLPDVNQSRSSDPVELLFVGRLVRAKGVLDLINATTALAYTTRHFRVTFAGSTRWSEPAIIQAIQGAVVRSPDHVRLVTDPDDTALSRLYTASSILVMPSYHEGYCLPVFEAFQAGCQVVAYSAGNLPAAIAGLGQLVEPGDIGALARAMRRAIAAASNTNALASDQIPTTDGCLGRHEWTRAVEEHIDRHSKPRYDRAFLALLKRLGFALDSETVAVGPT